MTNKVYTKDNRLLILLLFLVPHSIANSSATCDDSEVPLTTSELRRKFGQGIKKNRQKSHNFSLTKGNFCF